MRKLLILLLLVPVFSWATAVLDSTATSGTQTVVTAAGTLPSLDAPTGMAVNEMEIVVVVNDDANSAPRWEPETGYTFIVDIGDDTSDCQIGVYWRFWDGSTDQDPVTIDHANWPISSNSSVGWRIRVTGMHDTTPIDVVGTADLSDGDDTSVAASVTTTVADTLGFAVGCTDGDDGGPLDAVTGTGWSIWDELETTDGGGDGTAAAIATKTNTSAGATDAVTFDWAVTDGHAAIQFAIAPSASGALLLRRRR